MAISGSERKCTGVHSEIVIMKYYCSYLFWMIFGVRKCVFLVAIEEDMQEGDVVIYTAI